MSFTLPNQLPQAADDLVPSDHPYPRQTLTPAPTTTPDWARIPASPEPSACHEVWAYGWNRLTYAYFAARRALAAAGPDAVPAAGPDRAGLYTTTELFARAADAADMAIHGLVPGAHLFGAAIGIATLAYADAASDRAAREAEAARLIEPPRPRIDPFGPQPSP